MPARTHDQIVAHAKNPEVLTLELSQEEADLLIDQHIEHRRATSGKVPDRAFVEKKMALLNGIRICGKPVVVKR